MEEVLKGVNQHIVSYIIGLDSLKASRNSSNTVEDIRFRMDGLFELKEHALLFIREFTALYTNGPAGGGGIRLALIIALCFNIDLKFVCISYFLHIHDCFKFVYISYLLHIHDCFYYLFFGTMYKLFIMKCIALC